MAFLLVGFIVVIVGLALLDVALYGKLVEAKRNNEMLVGIMSQRRYRVQSTMRVIDPDAAVEGDVKVVPR